MTDYRCGLPDVAHLLLDDAVKSLARHLCERAGGDPDRMEPVTIISGDPQADGAARHDLVQDRPHWHRYALRAREFLAFREWEMMK